MTNAAMTAHMQDGAEEEIGVSSIAHPKTNEMLSLKSVKVHDPVRKDSAWEINRPRASMRTRSETGARRAATSRRSVLPCATPREGRSSATGKRP